MNKQDELNALLLEAQLQLEHDLSLSKKVAEMTENLKAHINDMSDKENKNPKPESQIEERSLEKGLKR